MAEVKRFAVDGVWIPTPSTFEVGIADISSDESGRDLSGTMHKDIVATKRTLKCVWSLLDWDKTAQILGAVDGKATFNFSYPDPMYPNVTTTKVCYVGDRSAPAYTLVEGKERWKGLSFNIIEV